MNTSSTSKLHITAHIERRTFYVDGKYLGSKAAFLPDRGETAKELTGDFYGEWQGTRHFDGEAIIQQHLSREVENRRLLQVNHPETSQGEMHCYPCRLGNWGEYRIVTNALIG